MAMAKRWFRPTEWDDAAQEAEAADYLWVEVDLHEDGSVIFPITLPFADYAGLEAEYTAAAATTVLEAAVETALGLTPGDADAGTRDDPDEYAPATE